MTLSRPRTSPKSPRIALLRGHPKNLQRTPRIERNSSTKKHSTIQCIYIDIEPLFQSAVVYDKHWLPFAITGLGHHSDSLEISQRNCLAQQSHHQLFRSHRSRCVSITTMKKKPFGLLTHSPTDSINIPNPIWISKKCFKNYFEIIQKCIQKYPRPRCREADQFHFCATNRQPYQTASLDNDHQHEQESWGDHDRTKATFVATD